MGEAHDLRDNRSWVVLELTHAGEAKIEEGRLPELLRGTLKVTPSFPVFLPAVTYESGGRRSTIFLMEGYAFVMAGLSETTYLRLETQSPYVKKVLTSKSPSGMRVLSVIPDSAIVEMKRQIAQQISSDLVEGMHVTVLDGVYCNLDGEVLGFHGEDAHVRFVLRSLDLIAKVPKVLLLPVKEDS